MPARKPAAPIGVYLEEGQKRVFASAAAWPGWTRPGKTEALALQALQAYGPRYAAVARAAGQRFPDGAWEFAVSERLPGSATTDFGAPGSRADAEMAALGAAEAARLAELLEAAWTVFDEVVRAAPAELRKGPRGGGRDRDKIVAHVVSTEPIYAAKLGLKEREPDPGDTRAITEMRARILQAVRGATGPRDAESKGWPPRYVVRRTAWHALDHAWEIEDRS